MTSELRLYTAREGRLDAFLEAWLAGVPRLRRVYGFEIEGAWVAREANRFFWVLSHPGDRDAFERADEVYYTSPERRALRPDPADELIVRDRVFVERVSLDDTPGVG
jgi:hypothetical protein